jgi:hypothetical protein
MVELKSLNFDKYEIVSQCKGFKYVMMNMDNGSNKHFIEKVDDILIHVL